MTRDHERLHVERARAGDGRALRALIDAVVNRRSRGRGATDLELYAYRMQRSVRLWTAYEIVALMQEIVWRLVMAPDGRAAYDPARARLEVVAWTSLRNRIFNQIKWEGRKSRGGGWRCERTPHVGVEHAEATPGTACLREDGCLLETAPDIDRVRDSLSGPARTCMVMLMAGHELGEVAELMSTPNNRWTTYRLRALIQSEIRPAMEPIREVLR